MVALVTWEIGMKCQAVPWFYDYPDFIFKIFLCYTQYINLHFLICIIMTLKIKFIFNTKCEKSTSMCISPRSTEVGALASGNFNVCCTGQLMSFLLFRC